MEKRINYTLDGNKKKRGTFSIAMAGVVILAVSMLVSCGYKQGQSEKSGSPVLEDGESSDVSLADGSEISEDYEMAGTSEEADLGQTQQVFDYNHEYNEMIRCYEGDVYLAREDGIYRIKGGGGEEELIYENSYMARRGMELYQDFLYFCGSAPRGEEQAATVYRMNLDTLEVKDALAAFSQKFDVLYSISIYESRLYVSMGYGQKIGFELDQDGEIAGQLDEMADDFLYREYNDYMELELQRWNAQSEEEYWKFTEETGKRYQAVIDVASCKKMLQGKQVVSRYKDELLSSVFLEDESGNYEHLCDVAGNPLVVTETGIYYAANEAGDIWYVDYETKRPQPFFKKDPEEWEEILLANYDADYIYLLRSRRTGMDEQENAVIERCLIRVSRQGGEGEEVYRFEDGLNIFGSIGLYRQCGVYGSNMYFENHDTINLNP